MAEQTAFHGVVQFLDSVGVYDIILPFLLVFTIVFAILEKTKILGLEKSGDKEYTKKNLNAIVAFVLAMLIIASTKLVAQINEIMANVVLLLILGISFLLLVGVFFGDKEFSLEKFKGWQSFFMILMFLGIVVIFLNALGWLDFIFDIFRNWNSDWAATLIFIVIIIGFIGFITWEKKPAAAEKKE